MRLVLDTNTVVSALLWHGTPHELVVAAQTRPVVFFTSPVAGSGLTPDQLMQRYRNIATVIHPAPIPPTVLADPDDDHVLACAASARADLIVSGDRDLLDLKTYQNIPIVTATEAVARIRKLKV